MCFLLACELDFGTEDPDIHRQTQILNVIVTPDTISLGDTARFECVIRDSLDERFRFRWVLNRDTNVLTDTPVLYWDTSDYEHTGLIQHSVRANNGTDPDSVSVQRSFTIYIKE